MLKSRVFMPLIVLLALLVAVPLEAAELKDLRLWSAPENTRVVLELGDKADYKVFTLQNPDRIVIDLARSKGAKVANAKKGSGAVRSIRAADRSNGSLRVVLDMAHAARPQAFLLDPTEHYTHRLVVDVPGTESNKDSNSKSESSRPPVAATPSVPWEPRPIIVAIDAGHGGEDPGAIGKSGLQEKAVALSVSRKLAALINAEPGYRAVLTRDGDYYLGLRERVERARRAEADLFVSVHANAVKSRKVRGSSVYVVSHGGASSEHARWLARKENAADLVGGVELQDKDDELAAVLIDLSQSSTMEASFDVGARVLSALGRVNPLQRTKVQQAGFMVLKAPDIPSVLVETAFITNATEERLLRSSKGQKKLAGQIFEGIKGYFESYRPRELQPDVPALNPHLQKVGSRPGHSQMQGQQLAH